MQEDHIDEMTAKWLSLTRHPPRIPVFHTLKTFTNRHLSGGLIISGFDGPTKKNSAFVDHLSVLFIMTVVAALSAFFSTMFLTRDSSLRAFRSPCDLSQVVFRRKVEKTYPRSAGYPLTPTPRTTLRSTPTDYPK